MLTSTTFAFSNIQLLVTDFRDCFPVNDPRAGLVKTPGAGQPRIQDPMDGLSVQRTLGRVTHATFWDPKVEDGSEALLWWLQGQSMGGLVINGDFWLFASSDKIGDCFATAVGKPGQGEKYRDQFVVVSGGTQAQQHNLPLRELMGHLVDHEEHVMLIKERNDGWYDRPSDGIVVIGVNPHKVQKRLALHRQQWGARRQALRRELQGVLGGRLKMGDREQQPGPVVDLVSLQRENLAYATTTSLLTAGPSSPAGREAPVVGHLASVVL